MYISIGIGIGIGKPLVSNDSYVDLQLGLAWACWAGRMAHGFHCQLSFQGIIRCISQPAEENLRLAGKGYYL